ncbi:MAG: hypothetical protein HQK51_07010 [Oligoflexia bacterium]|nr:hypothetical protein [Oligoflexia bacterium]
MQMQKKHYFFDRASEEDEQKLCELFRRNPMPGAISLLYTRDPSFFASIAAMGKSSDIFVCRPYDNDNSNDNRQEIVGVGVNSYLDMYVEGNIKELGYLHSLRFDKNHRGRGLILRAYNYFRDEIYLKKKSQIPFYLSTVIEDNLMFIKLLQCNRFPIPTYTDIGAYITYIILADKPFKKTPSKYQNSSLIIRNIKNQDELDKAIKFLNHEGSKKNFFPHYTKEDFLTLKNFEYQKHLYAIFLNDQEIIGTLGLWDQNSFKQTLVHSYDSKWKIIKPIYNFFSPLLRYKKLPNCGEKFSYYFNSFVATKDNDPELLSMLLKEVYRKSKNSNSNQNQNQNYHYSIIGLHEKDPLNQALKYFKTIKYRSRMYLVSYDEIDPTVLHSQKIPYLECARI